MHREDVLGPMLGRCGHLARERMDARMSSCDITPAQVHVLLYLCRYGGRASQSELTGFLRVKPSTANGILERMEEKELITRAVSPEDGRCRVITLTEKGRQQKEITEGCFRETEALIVRGFTAEEQRLLQSLLRRVINNLEEDRNL